MRGAMLLVSLAIGNLPAAAQTSVAGPLPSLLWSRAEAGSCPERQRFPRVANRFPLP